MPASVAEDGHVGPANVSDDYRTATPMDGSPVLEVRRLRLLSELQRRGTLAAVAQALSYSPSSVSEQLAQLEAEVGVALLEPVGRGVRLTEQGRILADHAQALLERLELAEADVAASVDEIAGTVRLAAFQTAAHAVVPAALTSLAQLHPALQVHVTEREPSTSLPALRVRDHDLVLAEAYPGHPLAVLPGLEHVTLQEDRLRLAVPTGWRSGAGAPASDLADRPWVMEPEGTPARAWALSWCRSAGFEPQVRFESTDVLFHVRLVSTGHAAAFLPALALTSPPTEISLRELPGRPARELILAGRRGSARHPAHLAVRAALEGSLSCLGERDHA
jgi:DNA-binding transcriptional LysR family regulator